MREIPGPEEDVITRFPDAEVPSMMLIVATSLSACRKVRREPAGAPPCIRGCRSGGDRVAVIVTAPAATAPRQIASFPLVRIRLAGSTPARSSPHQYARVGARLGADRAPVQSSGRSKTADPYPCRLMACHPDAPFGQAGTHSSHALHRSKSISIRPVAVLYPPSAAYSYFGLNSK